MGFLRKYIFANAGLKLLALAISFLLWATYTAEPYAEVGFQVPLEFTTMPAATGNVGRRTHCGACPRARPLGLAPPHGSRRSEPAPGHEGRRSKGPSILQITPEMVGAPYGATVVQVDPTEIHVTLVPRHGPAPPAG